MKLAIFLFVLSYANLAFFVADTDRWWNGVAFGAAATYVLLELIFRD